MEPESSLPQLQARAGPRLTLWLFRNMILFTVSYYTSLNSQAGGPPLVGCLRLLMQYIRSYPPYCRPLLHPQTPGLTLKNFECWLHCIYVFCMNLRTNRNFFLYIINRLVFITEVESVYFTVRTESLYNTYTSWLCTALQFGRSRVRSPMVSLKFFTDIILPAALWPWGWLSL